MDERIGTYNEDRSVKEWPAKTLTGQDYNRYAQPHATTRLSKQHFVVMDLSPIPVDTRDALLAELGGRVAMPHSATVVVTEPAKVRSYEPPRSGE